MAPLILTEAALLKGENGQTAEAVTILEAALNEPALETVPDLETQINAYHQLYKTEVPQ
jgi:hypothetical protein